LAFDDNLNLCASMKYWEIIADNLSKAGWSRGCVSGEAASDNDDATARQALVSRRVCAGDTARLFARERRFRPNSTVKSTSKIFFSVEI
jgi:hypothetical protein